MYGKLRYAGEIDQNTVLYRYMSLSKFVSLIELEKIYLTNVTKWEDTWEAPMRYIPAMYTPGKIEMPHFNLEETLYGQCWCKLGNSDALWRIYCKKNDGIMIKTTARKFELIEDFIRGTLAEVKYYKEDKLREQIKAIDGDKGYGPFGCACIKRDSFSHESEVRFIVCQQDHCEKFKFGCKNMSFKVNIYDFIEGIYIDPRSDDWFVESIKGYCKRRGFKIIPERSDLYSPNIFEKNKFYTEYIPAKNEEPIQHDQTGD